MASRDVKMPHRRDPVLFSEVKEGVVLIDMDSGEYYGLNEVGAAVWQLCDGSRNVAAVVQAVQDRYDAPLEVIAADVRELLNALLAEGLLSDG